MVHPYMFSKVIVINDVKPDEVKNDVKLDEVKYDVKSGVRSIDVELDVGKQIRNEQLFTARERMLEWVCMEARKLGFGIVIGRFDNGSNRRQTFVTMRFERNGTYIPPIRKLKRNDIELRKCECLFKLHRYHKVDDTWKFNVISNLHNHAL
ncbi:uncharacterized protein LOC127103238 [Lathyrus oleraceus]|uniref:uncharacterized protein LOC127103238 n=1 Tax=Pisum sativum TaxID=3888 RepID=UPI0021D287F7|nr:uncharacterized protein LOC127103238 [Pisum sativum]